MYSFCFRMRKEYFDAILRGEKDVEYRRNSPFWAKRIQNWAAAHGMAALFPLELKKNSIVFKGSFREDTIAVCLCGKRIHRRKIWGIALMKTPSTFSAQGRKDVDTELCWAFHLGEAIQ